MSNAQARKKGKVKWFNSNKGYGFITPDDSSDGMTELFAHYTAIKMSGYKMLEEGQVVYFNVERGAKGLQATEIKDEKEEMMASSA